MTMTLERQLVFESFRHSQGEFALQAQLLSRVHTNFGIEPDFSLDRKDFDKYIATLSRTHIPKDPRFSVPPPPALMISRNLEEVERKYKSYQKRSEAFTPTIGLIATGMLDQEESLLVVALGRLEDAPNNQERRASNIQQVRERMAHRVGRGMASFLIYHGQEGNPTGREWFDAIYDESWRHASAALSHRLTHLRSLIDELADAD